MATWPGRGRPKTAQAKRDNATPELKKKHALGLTKEVVDILLEKGNITKEEQWCALHLRWLHTLRYGLPCPTAINIEEHLNGKSSNLLYDEKWQQEREQEYTTAILHLKSYKAEREVMQAVIYNNIPVNIAALKAGLKALNNIWR